VRTALDGCSDAHTLVTSALTCPYLKKYAVPALCISWIDASLLAKDGMYKTTRGVTKEMYFTDDGFPVGIAYCLAILKQVGDVIVGVWWLLLFRVAPHCL
jgi:hypothetical protein